MIVALMAICFAQGMLGLYAADSDRLVIEGPLAATLSDAAVTLASRWHSNLFNFILVLASVHIAAALFYAIVKRDPLITAMVTGRKPANKYDDIDEARPGSNFTAAFCFVAAIVVVFAGISVLGGNPHL